MEVPQYPEHEPRQGFLEPADFAQLVPHLPDDGIRVFVRWLYATGMRRAVASTRITVPLPTAEWIALGTDATPKGYAIKTADRLAPLIFKVKVATDSLTLSGHGADWTYPLNDPPRGRVALRLRLRDGTTWCADAVAKLGGNPPTTAKSDDVLGKFLSEKQTLAPASRPAGP